MLGPDLRAGAAVGPRRTVVFAVGPRRATVDISPTAGGTTTTWSATGQANTPGREGSSSARRRRYSAGASGPGPAGGADGTTSR